MTMQLLPGFGLFDGPALPKVTPTPPPPPKRDDPAIDAAKKRQREVEMGRKGRASTILAPKTEQPLGSVSRPAARAATNLGGTS